MFCAACKKRTKKCGSKRRIRHEGRRKQPGESVRQRDGVAAQEAAPITLLLQDKLFRAHTPPTLMSCPLPEKSYGEIKPTRGSLEASSTKCFASPHKTHDKTAKTPCFEVRKC